ncbi:hypothetical protein JZ751_016727 [Albula glossodonta]|uniref:Uncharacterized protein n=1 Tax=Albula glossodonta TaxID=121402 RepID=A0A8T2NPD7_9TELE|nr:hypothetical protein JZ751_016727 [Albula glossodonta]
MSTGITVTRSGKTGLVLNTNLVWQIMATRVNQIWKTFLRAELLELLERVVRNGGCGRKVPLSLKSAFPSDLHFHSAGICSIRRKRQTREQNTIINVPLAIPSIEMQMIFKGDILSQVPPRCYPHQQEARGGSVLRSHALTPLGLSAILKQSAFSMASSATFNVQHSSISYVDKRPGLNVYITSDTLPYANCCRIQWEETGRALSVSAQTVPHNRGRAAVIYGRDPLSCLFQLQLLPFLPLIVSGGASRCFEEHNSFSRPAAGRLNASRGF